MPSITTRSSARKVAKSAAGMIEVGPLPLGDRVLPGLALDHGVDRGLRAARSSAGTSGAAKRPRQLKKATSTPCSFSVGMSTPGSRSSEERASARSLPAFDLRAELAVAGDADGDVAAQDRGQRLAAARVGDVVELGEVGADRLHDQPGDDVVGAADRSAAPGDRTRIGLQRGDEVVERLDRRVDRNDDDLELADDAGERRDLVEGNRRLVGDDGTLQGLAGDRGACRPCRPRWSRTARGRWCRRRRGRSGPGRGRRALRPAARSAWRGQSDPSRRPGSPGRSASRPVDLGRGRPGAARARRVRAAARRRRMDVVFSASMRFLPDCSFQIGSCSACRRCIGAGRLFLSRLRRDAGRGPAGSGRPRRASARRGRSRSGAAS